MAAKKDLVDKVASIIDTSQTFNPLLNMLKENDKKNLFNTNVTTAFHKTGFPVFDYFFGALINVHDELGNIIRQEPRVGQAAGTFNLIVGDTGSGKAQPLSTKIPTPNGYKLMGDLKVGDKIFGSDGEIYTVIGVYPQGTKDVYEITFSDGRTARCCEDHLWNVNISKSEYTKSMSEIINLFNEGSVINIPAFVNPSISCNKLNYDNKCFLHIIDIKEVGREECQCIMINSPDHLYVTEDFIITHNTTLAEQIAGYIMIQYKHSNAILFDCEQRTSISRVETVTKLPSYFFNSGKDSVPPRFMIRSGAVGLDVIQEMIVKLYVSKMKLKKELRIPSGFKDEFGSDVIIYPPTFIIIDSITTVLNETFSPDSSKEAAEAEKMRGNTEGARDAKTLKGFFKDILPLCKEANIIIYGINHLNQNMSMNSFLPVAKQQNFLKQSESIPGGKTMLYYPHNIIKLIAKPSDDFTEESDGFAGHIVMVEPIKSSSNQSGNDSKGVSFEMIFSFRDGFLPLRTMIWYGRNNGIIEGTKARMKFREDDSFTFSWKNIEKEKDEKPIWENLKKYVFPHLDTHLPYLEPSDIKLDMRMFEY